MSGWLCLCFERGKRLPARARRDFASGPTQLTMGPSQLAKLPPVPAQRGCGCGGRILWSHREYLGSGRTAGIYICSTCGLAYRGGEPPRSPSPNRGRRPLPDGGSPQNPVLDEEMGERLKRLLAQP